MVEMSHRINGNTNTLPRICISDQVTLPLPNLEVTWGHLGKWGHPISIIIKELGLSHRDMQGPDSSFTFLGVLPTCRHFPHNCLASLTASSSVQLPLTHTHSPLLYHRGRQCARILSLFVWLHSVCLHKVRHCAAFPLLPHSVITMSSPWSI
jgi:hypothetical protein